jgi:hypothetical protein
VTGPPDTQGQLSERFVELKKERKKERRKEGMKKEGRKIFHTCDCDMGWGLSFGIAETG